MDIGLQELLVIGLIAAIFFGAKRLPDLARSLGKAIGEFRKATREFSDPVVTVKSAMKDTVRDLKS